MIPMQPPFRFVPGEYRVKHVTEAWERAACAALRREVFCQEQGLFEGDDADAVDGRAIAIAALACVAGAPEFVAGTVRIHQTEAGVWWGSRLAAQRGYRGSAWLGTQLIRHAVSTAQARGCTRFLAHVQVQNVKLFESLHWQGLEAVTIRGRPHLLMQADLMHYPARYEDEVAFYTATPQAA